MASHRYGLDTGFFFELFEAFPTATSIWRDIIEESATGIVASLSVYELQVNAMKGVLVREDVEELLQELPHLCVVRKSIAIDTAVHAARLAWGNNLAMADALILQQFLEANVTRIFTTDRDFLKYEGGPEVELL